MAHLIFFISLLALLVGIGGLVIAGLSYGRTRLTIHKRNLQFLGVFSVSVFLFFLLNYIRNTIPDPSTALILGWGLADACCDIGIVLTGIFLVHSLFPKGKYQLYPAVLWAVCLLGLGLVVLSLLIFGDRVSRLLVFGLFCYYLLFLYLLFISFTSLFQRKTAQQWFYGLSLFLFALVGFLESLRTIPQLWNSPMSLSELLMPSNFYVSTLAYLIWTVVTSIFLLKNDLQPTENQEDRVDRFCIHFKVSSRERDVLSLLLKGWKNQRIADELCISLQTVKTHVHNLLKKTLCTSRSQLISKIQSKDGGF